MSYDAISIISSLEKHLEKSKSSKERVVDIYMQILDEIESRLEDTSDSTVMLAGRKDVNRENLNEAYKIKDEELPFHIKVMVWFRTNKGKKVNHDFLINIYMRYGRDKTVRLRCGRSSTESVTLDRVGDARLEKGDLKAYVDNLLQEMEIMVRETPLGLKPDSEVVLPRPGH